MDAEELLARYAAGERNFLGVNLSGKNLNGANLNGADLSGAKLIYTNLYEADLSGADLTGANLSKANLSKANLSGAKLICAGLIFTALSGANLNGANLSGANLISVNLYGAELSKTDLCGANLFCANLGGAKLNEAYLVGANLFKVNLTNANLSGAKLDGTILAYQEGSEELRQASNQGLAAPYQWNGLYFRSKTEIKIAEALDRAGVLFYPNCKARISTPLGREGKETDFLVFYQRECGILEVDGEPWHPPSRTVHDHERDRLFKIHGIRIVEHYDATRCWEQPDEVVREFLEILRQA